MTQTIIGTGNEYVIKLKGNQPKLLAAATEHCKQAIPLDTFRQAKRRRGRHEARCTEVYSAPAELDPGWERLRRVIRLERSGRRGGARYRRVSYYISSLEASAERLAEGIRGHWGIENRLHWVKDAHMNEDGSGIGSKPAAANLSLLKSWGLTFYRRGGYDSLKEAIALFTNNIKELLQLIRT